MGPEKRFFLVLNIYAKYFQTVEVLFNAAQFAFYIEESLFYLLSPLISMALRTALLGDYVHTCLLDVMGTMAGDTTGSFGGITHGPSVTALQVIIKDCNMAFAAEFVSMIGMGRLEYNSLVDEDRVDDVLVAGAEVTLDVAGLDGLPGDVDADRVWEAGEYVCCP